MSSSEMSSVRQALAQNIMRARKSHKLENNRPWTQAHLAQLCGVSIGTIQKIESGASWPDWKTVVKISDVLEINVDSLYDKESNTEAMSLEAALNIVNEALKIELKPAEKKLKMDASFFLRGIESELDEVKKNLPPEVHRLLESLVHKAIGRAV